MGKKLTWMTAAVVATVAVHAHISRANAGPFEDMVASVPKTVTDPANVATAFRDFLKSVKPEVRKFIQHRCGHAARVEANDGIVGPLTARCLHSIAVGIAKANVKNAEVEQCDVARGNCEVKVAARDAEIADLRSKIDQLSVGREPAAAASVDPCASVERSVPCQDVKDAPAGAVCNPTSQMLRCDEDPDDPNSVRFVAVPKCTVEHTIVEGGARSYDAAGRKKQQKLESSVVLGVPNGYYDCPPEPPPPAPPEPTFCQNHCWWFVPTVILGVVGGGLAIAAVANGGLVRIENIPEGR